MADYQEYRRRVLHRRWRRRFMAAGLLFLLVLLGAVSVMWKRLHRDPAQTRQDTILQEITEDNTWNTLQYASTRPLTVQTLSTGTTTALDFRMAALPRTAPVEKSWFSQVSFVGDSLTQGMQMYDTGLPGAMFCAYRGVGPNAIVNGTSCKRADGVAEVPLDALTAQQPKAVYLLLGTNVLGTDSDYTSFLTYYRLMLDMITQALPGTPVYVQSITPVLLFPQPMGGAGRRERRPEGRIRPAGRLPPQAGRLHGLGGLPVQPHGRVMRSGHCGTE